MKVLHFFSYLLFVSLFLLACGNPQPTGEVIIQNSGEKEKEEKAYMQGNRRIVELEQEEIDLFLERYQWNVIKTGTGLNIEVLKEGKGAFPIIGDTVVLTYITSLLDGKTLYNSDAEGNKIFVLEKSQEIPALHEAVKLLKKNGKARMVIPSHLAYGSNGDGNKIREYQPLVMYIERIK
ncbi:MAG: FKBP-type peptidyl-prolyl cis-trans isomerase [Bacteroidales bacterium]|jgi:FKBP-type peptidyl-prolyl cis-trans isomerase|nr:FKBP-type peptidyl-prolyl cis-trans isomerase [Bacteroidales bacterium]